MLNRSILAVTAKATAEMMNGNRPLDGLELDVARWWRPRTMVDQTTTGLLARDDQQQGAQHERDDHGGDRTADRDEVLLRAAPAARRPRLLDVAPPGRPGPRRWSCRHFRSSAGHVGAENLRRRRRGLEFGVDQPVEHHDDPIRQRQQFFEVGGDEQHGQTGIAGVAEVLPDRRLCTDIDAAGRVRSDQDAGIAVEFAADQQLLLIATGQGVQAGTVSSRGLTSNFAIVCRVAARTARWLTKAPFTNSGSSSRVSNRFSQSGESSISPSSWRSNGM